MTGQTERQDMPQHTTTTTTRDGRPLLPCPAPPAPSVSHPRSLGDVFLSAQHELGERGAGWLGALVTHAAEVTCWRPEHPSTARTAGLALVVVGTGERVHALSVDTINATTSATVIVDRGAWSGAGWLTVDPTGLVSALAIADANHDGR